MKAYVTYPGGQSGNPGSGRYDTFLKTWEAGEYYEAVFMKSPDARKDKIVGGQLLKPKK
jgi:acyl-homoserine lactone acylase PvdQ